MAEVCFTAEKFPSLPLGASTYKPVSGSVVGREATTITKLCAYAATVGDASVLSGGPGRPVLEIEWRQAMLAASLEEYAGHFRKTNSYNRLDGSEKTAVSYFLGMIQAAFMADALLGIPTVVHVDRMLHLLGGKVPRKSRPDLVGYTRPSYPHGVGRILLEAKGRTHGYAQAPIDHALKQVKAPIPVVASLLGPNSIGVASLSYFATPAGGSTSVWHSYLEDPSPPGHVRSGVGDDEFRGIVLASQLLPVALAIRDLQMQEMAAREQSGWVSARLPTSESTISLPLPMYDALLTIEGPLREPRYRERVARNIWEIAAADDYLELIHGDSAEVNVEVLESGLAMSTREELN